MGEPYDWADDPNLSDEEVLRRFHALPAEPREDAVVASVRLPVSLSAALKAAAADQGCTVSDVIRKAIERVVRVPIGWQCEHFNITSSPGVLGRPTTGHGCEMEPVYRLGDLRPVPVVA